MIMHTRSQQMSRLDQKWTEREMLGKRRESRLRRNGKIRPCTLLLRLHNMASWGGRPGKGVHVHQSCLNANGDVRGLHSMDQSRSMPNPLKGTTPELLVWR